MRYVLIAFLLAFAAAGVYGASGEPSGTTTSIAIGYLQDSQTAAYRPSIAAVDSTGWGASTLTAIDASSPLAGPIALKGRANLSVSARFVCAGQAVTIVCGWFYVNSSGTSTFLGESANVTLTASAADQDPSGLYVAPTYDFVGRGATHARIRIVTAPVVGAVSLWCGTF